MRRIVMRTLSSTIMLAALTVGSGPALAAPGWFCDDPRVAFARAESENVPVLIVFHTTWCESCERMDRTTWQDTEVQALLGRVVPLSVDGDRDRNLSLRYDVVAFPTMVLAEPSGSPALIVRGMQDAQAMRGHLTAVLGRWDVLRVWAVDASGKHPDPEAVLGLAEFAYARDAWDRAEQLFRKVLRDAKNVPESVVARARVGLGELLARSDRCREARKVLSRIPDSDTFGQAARRDEIVLSCEDG